MGASQVEETSAQAQKLYTCEHCQVTFLRPVHLERHMRNVHSQEQESECKVCHKLFQNKYYLSVHMLTHAMDKELECPLCKKRFPDLDTLNKHKDAHLGISMNNPANRPFTQGTTPQLNSQPGAGNVAHPAVSTAGNVAHPAVSTAGSGSTTSTYSGADRGNTFNCDLRRTDLNSINRTARNYRGGQPAVQNAMRAPSNKNSTVSCDLRLGDINSLNQNATNSIRLPQKRPSNDSSDVIVTGISSLKRPFRMQGLSSTNTSRNQGSAYGPSLVSTANKTPIASIAQSSSRNSFLQNQLRTQNSMANQHNANNSMTNRNVTDRIYLTSEGVSSQSTVRNSLPARISYSNRKQLANHLNQNNRFGNNSIYSNLSHQRNQLLRNSNQTNQRSVVNCDLTRSNLGTINRRPGLPYSNTSQQFSNGTKELDSTVNCDLTISNISSLNKSQWPTNSNSVSRSAPLRNYGLSTRPVSTVNFDLTTADINVLKRDRRLRQAGRVLGPGPSTTGQTPNTLNCDLSMVNLSSIEKNRPTLNNGNRFGRLNPNVMTSQNSQMVQNTVNCDLTTNNLNDWNRRNTICYRAQNQQSIPRQHNRQPPRPFNSNLSNVNLSNLNQRAVNNIAAGQSTQQQVRPVQVYANTSHPAVLQRQKNAAALGNRSSSSSNNFGVQGSNNVLRTRTFPRRMASVSQPVSAMSSFNRSRMSRMIRQRKTLDSSIIPVIDLDPDEDMSVVLKNTTQPTNTTNVVQFDLTGPDVNVTTYQNGGSSYSNKQPSGNLVDIVELETSNNTAASQPASNNATSVVEFDLSNTSIQAFSTGQNEPSSACTINLDTDDWASNSRNITTGNNTSSDVTLLEVRKLNKPTKESNQNVPDITLSNVRSLSTLQSTSADDRSTVSGITLVDIRSLSTSEIDANFQDDSEKSQTKVSSGSVPDNSSSVRRRSTRALSSSRDTDADTMPAPSLVLDNDAAVDLCSIDGDNAEANVITESVSASEDQADNKVELKEDYFTCKICNEQIRHLCNYISHLKSHNDKEFCKCYYCDSVFGNIQELVVHSVVHVGDLKKQCVFCREVLASGEDPITHMTGCGEFQCIMFESGTRVKIEKSYQKEGDKEAETGNVVQNQVDQDDKTKSMTQNQTDQGKETESAAPNQTENVVQKQIDQDCETENVAESQVDQDGEKESIAQNQVDQTKKTEGVTQSQIDDSIKVAAQNQVDEAESVAKNQVNQGEKSECVTPEEEMESPAQNQVDQDDSKELDQSVSMQDRKKEKGQETDRDGTEKVMGEMTKGNKVSGENKEENNEGEETKEADGNESGKAHKEEDTVPIRKAESQMLEAEMSDIEGTELSDKKAEESVTENINAEEAEKSNTCLNQAEKSDPCFDEAENMDSCLDGSEKLDRCLGEAKKFDPFNDEPENMNSFFDDSDPLFGAAENTCLDEPEKMDVCPDEAETAGPCLDEAETAGPCLDEAETAGPCLDEAETAGPCLDEAETAGPCLDEAETAGPCLDEAETAGASLDEAETAGASLDDAETAGPLLAEVEMSVEPKVEETIKMKVDDQSGANDDDDEQSVNETNLNLEGWDEKVSEEENIIGIKIKINAEEMKPQNTTELLVPMEHDSSEKTDLAKVPETMDSKETEQISVKMEEDDDYSTSWCKWEKDMILKSQLAASAVTNAKVKIEKEFEGDCQKEIEFEVNIDEIKTEIDDTKETLEGS